MTKSDFHHTPPQHRLVELWFQLQLRNNVCTLHCVRSQRIGGAGLSSPLSELGADSVLLAGPHTRPPPEMLLTITRRHAVDKRMPRQEPVDSGFAWVKTVRETARFGMPSVASASRKLRELRVDGGSILSRFTKTLEIVESRAWPLGIPCAQRSCRLRTCRYAMPQGFLQDRGRASRIFRYETTTYGV